MGRLHIIVIAAASALLVAARPARTFEEGIEQFKRSVAPISCGHYRGGKYVNDTIMGTAFFISDDGQFLTAAHVIAAVDNSKGSDTCKAAVIAIPKAGTWERTPTNTVIPTEYDCIRNDNHDLALCNAKLKSGTNVTPVAFETRQPKDGTEIAFTGFPLSLVVPLSARGYVAALRRYDDGFGPMELFLDRTAWPGSSGSPVYLSTGKVVGLVIETGRGHASGLAIARPIAVIRPFLEQNGLVIDDKTGTARKHTERKNQASH